MTLNFPASLAVKSSCVPIGNMVELYSEEQLPISISMSKSWFSFLQEMNMAKFL